MKKLENTEEKTRSKNVKKSGIFDKVIAVACLGLGCVMLLLTMNHASVNNVEGHSMEPTLVSNEKVLGLEKKKYQHGEVIMVRKNEVKKFFVKRVIGIPGDEVEIKDDEVYVNGKKINEDYINEPMKYVDDQKITLKKNEYWIMGDNRNHSDDSRTFGAVEKRDIIGKVEGVIDFTKKDFRLGNSL